MEFTENSGEVYLIGQPIREFGQNKLPSNKECLQRFAFFHFNCKNTIRDSARNTAKEIFVIYAALGIETKSERRATEDLVKLYNVTLTLKKNKSLKSNIEKVEAFKNKMMDDFDVSLVCLKREVEKADSTFEESEVVEPRKRMKCNEFLSLNAVGNVVSGDEDWGPKRFGKKKVPHQNGKKLLSSEITTSFDRCGVSHRKAHLVYNSMHPDVAVSYSTLRRRRNENRQLIAENIKQAFMPGDVCVVHWDGKMLLDCTGEKVERMAVLVSCAGNSKLLGVPKLAKCTGEAQASAVYHILEQWNLSNKIVGMCFDTTSTNTGVRAGACVLLEKKLNKNLTHFACRHHILELLAKAAFDELFGNSTSPNIPLFEKFRSVWPGIDVANFKTAKEDPSYFRAIGDQHHFIEFCGKQIMEKQPRNDYKEFLELCLIFLGEVPPSGFSFKKPGPIHRARWMSRVIFSLKIYIFRNQYSLTPGENDALERFCAFIIQSYAQAWFTAPLAIKAPRSDLILLKSVASKAQDPMWKAVEKKLLKHLWYLNGDLVGLSFFDENVSFECKRRMVNSLEKPENNDKVASVSLGNIKNLDLEDFVNQKTMSFFRKLGIGTSFLLEDPEDWANNTDFVEGRKKVEKIAVVNDNAERAIALTTEFNECITKDEEQKQYLLQLVEHSRKVTPIV